MNIRIYYEDTDCGGVVYYANYLRYMERSRTEIMRDAGVELVELRNETGMQFAIVDAHIRYRSPAVYNDLITLNTSITECSAMTVTFHTDIFNASGKLLVEGDVKAVCLDKDIKACRMPKTILEKLKSLKVN